MRVKRESKNTYKSILKHKLCGAIPNVDCTAQRRKRIQQPPRLCAMLWMQASDEEVDDVFPDAPLYCGRAGSDVIGCRRPTCGVFVCMLQTRVTLTAFLIVTPRGRSVSFPTQGTRVTYVTLKVLGELGGLYQ